MRMRQAMQEQLKQALTWLLSERHRAQARTVRAEVTHAFTAHPNATGESYLQHLWFTITMAARFFYAMTVLMIHGLLPFLLVRAASSQSKVFMG